MKYRSTSGKSSPCSVSEAIFHGLAPDGGLFMPCEIPNLRPAFVEALPSLSLSEIALEVLSPYFLPDIAKSDLQKITEDCFSFPVTLKQIGEETYVLELFHGPTLAFKDFGARFLARTLSFLRGGANRSLTVLVATSGDTGGAVAHGFYRVPGIEVVILYPSGKVSPLQEKQLTTLGENISALEVDGTFDDCQALTKKAFLDADLLARKELTSANSISIGRLLPQMVYYFLAYGLSAKQEQKKANRKLVFSVPSGNLGNLTAGVFAERMGLPTHRLILATNENDGAAQYLQTGTFTAKPSKLTCSNAMDVGNPSNMARLQDLFQQNVHDMRSLLWPSSFNDQQTKAIIQATFQQNGYLLDPHGAVGLLGWQKFQREQSHDQDGSLLGIILETAHPAKFIETVEAAIGRPVPLPAALDALRTATKTSQRIGKSYEDLKSFLLRS